MKREFVYKSEADEAQKHLKELLPVVRSAYQPSGRMAIESLILVPLGAVIAAVLGVGLGLLMDGGAILCWKGSGWLDDSMKPWPLALKILSWGGIVVLWILALLLYAISYFAVVGAFGATLSSASRRGKNRSVFFAVLIALVGTAATIYAYWMALDYLEWTRWYRGHSEFYDDTFKIARWVMGGFIILVGGFILAEEVKEAKFCEECQLYMNEMQLPKLDEDGALTVAHLLDENRLEEAAVQAEHNPGDDCVPHLYLCPFCGKGFIDYKFTFEATYKQGGDENGSGESKETWIIATRQLDSEEADVFRTHSLHRGGGPLGDRLRRFGLGRGRGN